MMLDATAGNRLIWENKNPPHTIFIDKEVRLKQPPHVFADNTRLPFREHIFDCILFDPPFGINMPPWWTNPESKPGRHKDYVPAFYGDFKSKRELLSYIHKAQKEFQRYTNRLCLKWCERNVNLWNILSFFTRDGWRKIHELQIKEKQGTRAWRNVGKRTYWVTFIRGLHRKVKK